MLALYRLTHDPVAATTTAHDGRNRVSTRLERENRGGTSAQAATLLRLTPLLALLWLALPATDGARAEVAYGTEGAEAAAPSSPASAQAGHRRVFPRGLKFEPAEKYQQHERTSPTRGMLLPSAADLSALFPPPKDQGDQSSCVGWSVGYAMRGYYANRAQGRSKDRDPILLSPSFVYNQIADSSEGCDSGSDIADALTLLRDVGTVPMSRFPYRDTSCSRRPPADVKREAGQWRIQSWRTVDLTSLSAIKEQIAKGNPVVIGMYVNDAFTELTGDTVFKEMGRDGGGHAMVVVGYDDRKRAFRLINSWGDSWGENGFGWISYDSFKARTDEAYVATVAGLPPLPNAAAPANTVAPTAPRPTPQAKTEPEPEEDPEDDPEVAPEDDPEVAPEDDPEVAPEDDPEDTPEDTDATPPELSAKGRLAFEAYLAARSHRAFAVAPDGAYGWRSGRDTASDAEEEAAAACESHTSRSCRVVNIDGRPAGGKKPTKINKVRTDKNSSDPSGEDEDEDEKSRDRDDNQVQ